MTKELCNCGKLAVWVYMPGYSSGDSPYSCDDCVPRGCECNYRYCEDSSLDLPEGEEGVDWEWVDKPAIWSHLDDKGRQHPCSEYDYESDGFEREINPHILN